MRYNYEMDFIGGFIRLKEMPKGKALKRVRKLLMRHAWKTAKVYFYENIELFHKDKFNSGMADPLDAAYVFGWKLPVPVKKGEMKRDRGYEDKPVALFVYEYYRDHPEEFRDAIEAWEKENPSEANDE